MLLTKAFADLCGSSKKTIIYYDRIGILKPYKTNKKGFRFYRPRQVLVFQKIQMLKYFGLTLKEIKQYLRHKPLSFDLFSQQKKELKEKREALTKKINKIEEFIASLKKNQVIITPKIKTIAPYMFYGIDKTGRYIDIKEHQEEIFKLKGEKQATSIGLTVFYGNSYVPHKAKMTTGVLIKQKNPPKIKGTRIIKTPSYQAVVYTHIGPYSYLSYVWQFLKKFVKTNKLKKHPKISEREFYLYGPLAGAKEDDFITQLQIPIL